MDINSLSRSERSAMMPPNMEKAKFGVPYMKATRPSWMEDSVMSSTSNPRTRNCMPWAIAWVAPFIQNQRKLL